MVLISIPSLQLTFPPEVTWMVVEFDKKSCTAQQEDYLQMFVPASMHPSSSPASVHRNPPQNSDNFSQPAFKVADFGAERKSDFGFYKNITVVKNASTELWLKRECLSNDDEEGECFASNSHSKSETYKNVVKEKKEKEEEEEEEEWISVGERMWGDRWPQGGLVVPGELCVRMAVLSFHELFMWYKVQH